MRIARMTATFGCLDGAVLELTEGVNTLTLSNEGGKSTWAAFVTAMFYGLDPRRSAKGRLSDKERFSPWSGKAMEGTLELVSKGRTIVLQRTSAANKPFSVFRAWDKTTGLEIAGLTGENCGRTLLGVERSVFCRSALLCGTQLAVTQDNDLSARLSALAAAGRQSDGFVQTEERLKTWQNRLRYHNSGAIVQLQQKIAAMQAAQEESHVQTSHLPQKAELLRMLAKLEDAQAAPGICPTALLGVQQEQIVDKARKDLARNRLLAVLFAVLTALFLAASVLWMWCLVPAMLCAAVLCVLVFGKALPRAYGVKRRDRIMEAALRWRDGQLRRWEQTLCMEQVRAFAPEVQTPREAAQAVQEAISLYQQAEQRKKAEPDREVLAQLTAQLQELERKEQAIILARQALRDANGILQKTYVPQLTKLAGEYLERLTLGRYDGVVMDENLELSLRQAQGLVRPLAGLSKGTQDQAWLALRLAMTRLLLPEGTPLILDDALLTFDRSREKAALELLQREQRQAIVLSCR